MNFTRLRRSNRCPKSILRVTEFLMPAAIVIMLVGGYIGFVAPDAWPLQAQVLAHISIMLGAVFLKLSYVMHLNASMHLGINDFAFRNAGKEPRSPQFPLPQCCVAGQAGLPGGHRVRNTATSL